MRVVRHWHRPKEVVGSLFLETFRVKLNKALSNLVRLKVSLLLAGGWTRQHLKVKTL